MNRYPLWKYLLIAATLILAGIYTLPNFYGMTPAIQVSSSRSSIPVSSILATQVKEELKSQNITTDGVFFDDSYLRVRFKDADTQLKARDAIQQALGEGYIVALTLLPASPSWLKSLKAHPMFLGLDLRGGVHFLLEVDMQAAVEKTMARYSSDLRQELKNNKIRYRAIKRNGHVLELCLRDIETKETTQGILKRTFPSLVVKSNDTDFRLTLTPAEIIKIQSDAVKQNITTLHNRVNELGTAEPIIQQNGPNRILVQLPGIQDSARAKDIIGRTATLEVRMVEDDPIKQTDAIAGNLPDGYELLDGAPLRGGLRNILVRKDVELTGDNINDAQAGFDDNGAPAVHINLDAAGASIFRQLTSENIGKHIAMVLVGKNSAEVITAPVIRTEIGGGRVQISGNMSAAEANDTALLLRAGSLAAPMNIIEEHTVGPSLGQENIKKGVHATLWGFTAIAIFMMMYYGIFGVFASLSLAINMLLLLALLSIIQATLTLPGIAAIALALGMAIDSNVLINERIREELRNGLSPHAAIQAGYNHAWHTILDSNVTTLIAGLALLIFSSGAVRGFAVVHSMGILTSMFSAVLVSRALVTLWYGSRRKLTSLAIGQVRAPEHTG